MALGGIGAVSGPVEAGDPKPKCGKHLDSAEAAVQCVELNGVLQHEKKFAHIAKHNDGNRAAGTPGYDESADYVAKEMKKAGYVVTRQTFSTHIFARTGPSEMQQVNSERRHLRGEHRLRVHHGIRTGDVTAHVTAVDIQLGLGNTSTSGGEAADFAGFPAGYIALLQRGVCTFEIKAENADAAGASGVLFFNQGNTVGARSERDPGCHARRRQHWLNLPALSTTYAIGADLFGHLRPGDANLRQRQPLPGDVRQHHRRVRGVGTRTTSSWRAPTSTWSPRDLASTTTVRARAGLLEVAEELAKA